MKNTDKQRANRVIEVFNSTGLNQREFSKLIGVSQQLVSAVVNYTKKPNETILLGILDHIEGIDPMWLFTGNGNYKSNSILFEQEDTPEASPIEVHIKKIVREEFKDLSKDILQKLSNIEDSIKNSH
ncbi:helix-turn-helix domain-containing protein [Polaribacter sp.]|uniref:helix-turn-helix domain-containing protein n=1 Tax=Polaribacter sp. TaxID=1920175 RepID=UPI003F6C8338